MLLPGAPPEASPHRGSLMPWALEGSSLAGGGGVAELQGHRCGHSPSPGTWARSCTLWAQRCRGGPACSGRAWGFAL